jgi:hypothetical protein
MIKSETMIHICLGVTIPIIIIILFLILRDSSLLTKKTKIKRDESNIIKVGDRDYDEIQKDVKKLYTDRTGDKENADEISLRETKRLLNHHSDMGKFWKEKKPFQFSFKNS